MAKTSLFITKPKSLAWRSGATMWKVETSSLVRADQASSRTASAPVCWPIINLRCADLNKESGGVDYFPEAAINDAGNDEKNYRKVRACRQGTGIMPPAQHRHWLCLLLRCLCTRPMPARHCPPSKINSPPLNCTLCSCSVFPYSV